MAQVTVPKYTTQKSMFTVSLKLYKFNEGFFSGAKDSKFLWRPVELWDIELFFPWQLLPTQPISEIDLIEEKLPASVSENKGVLPSGSATFSNKFSAKILKVHLWIKGASLHLIPNSLMAWHWFNSFSLLKSSCLKTSSFDKDLITYNLSKPSKMKYQVLKESSVRNVCCPLMAGNHSQTNSNRKIGTDLFSL